MVLTPILATNMMLTLTAAPAVSPRFNGEGLGIKLCAAVKIEPGMYRPDYPGYVDEDEQNLSIFFIGEINKLSRSDKIRQYNKIGNTKIVYSRVFSICSSDRIPSVIISYRFGKNNLIYISNTQISGKTVYNRINSFDLSKIQQSSKSDRHKEYFFYDLRSRASEVYPILKSALKED